MTELASLLSCLHQTPEDDVLWLAVADRLEEAGETDRAELLRLCRRLRTMDQASGPPPGGRVSSPRAAAESRIRELVNGGVRPCVPEITNGIGMRFALIPPGTFWMGSPDDEEGRYENETRHEVTLTRPFWLGVSPVTQSQYEAVMGKNPSYFSKKGEGEAKVKTLDTGSYPVEQVSWDDAVKFCEALSARPEEKASGNAFRLPTEAEWEYCCRGGLASKPFHFGDTLDKTQANFHAGGLKRTSAVGSYPPNAFGLHDMHGNVWEWCSDWYGDYPAGQASDPTGPAEGTDRVVRGGSWGSGSGYCRSAFRVGLGPSDRVNYLGFRAALVPPSK